MKHALCIVFTSLAFYLSAQHDSLPKLRLAAITAEGQLLIRGEHANTATAADFQKHISNDDLLNRTAMQANTTGYGVSAYNFFPGVASVKAFFDLRPVKGHRRQAFIGLSYSRVQHLSLSYLNMVYDTTSTIMGTNNYTVNVDAYQSAYSFDISGIKLQVPVGINFITNNNRRFWFSAGAELCPGLSLANVYRAAYEKSRSQYVLDAYSSYKKVSSYKRSGNREVLEQAAVKKQAGGAGFTGYIAIPLTMNVTISKKLDTDNIGLFATLAPGYYLTANTFTGSQSFLFINASAGVRYNIHRK